MSRFCFLSFCILYLFSMNLYAQENALLIEYSCAIRYCEEQNVPEQEVRRLVIGDSTSYFVGENDTEDDVVLKNYPQKGMLTYKGKISYPLFYYQESIPTFDWDFMDADTTICGYSCQKAQMHFRGRNWIVWYATDLPYNDGPWKLSGLPGLILKAQDAKGDFLFTAYKISKTKFDKSIFTTKRYKKITPKEFAEYLIFDRKDSFAFIEAMTGIKTVINGKSSYFSPKTACLLEYFDNMKSW